MAEIYAYPLVGTTGLCNMLYPWARAVVWARDNGARVIAPNWVQFRRLGVWIRRERDKRTYLNQFTDDGYITGLLKWWLLKTKPLIDVGTHDSERERDGIWTFSGREEWGWMNLVKSEADFLRKELERIVNPKIVRKLTSLPARFIGVHIRRGDFRYGDEMLPDQYYLTAIALARKDIGDDIPILVFSDGTQSELAFLTKAQGVLVMPHAPAVHDLLALSRAEAIVGTNHSTFSYWGAFLSCGKRSYWSAKGHRATLPEDICPMTYV